MKLKNLDVIGLSAAFICLIHCLLFPTLLLLDESVFSHNVYIDLSFLAIGIIVVAKVTKTMKSKFLFFLFWSSIGLIFISILMDLLYHFHSPLTYVGAIGLIVGHVLNLKRHQAH